MLVSTAHVLFVFLLLLSDNRMVAAVCRHCHGGIPGCPGRHDNDDCTAYTGVAANVAALAVGATTTLSVAKLLPLSMLRVFTRRALDILLTLTRRPPSGTPYDFTGKPPADILRAVADRAVDTDDAIIHLASAAADPSLGAGDRAATDSVIKSIEVLRKGALGSAGTRVGIGRFTYVLALVQKYLSVPHGQLANLSVDDFSGEPSTSSSAAPMAKVRAFESAEEFFEGLNLWVMVVSTTGLATSILALRFVEESVYHTIRKLGYSWMVAAELFLIYLELVDIPEGIVYTLVSVMQAGGLDTHIAQAHINAISRYGARFRPRAKGGEQPRQQPGKGGDGDGVKFNGKFSTDPNRAICLSFNFKDRDHKSDELLEDGTCKRRHVCSAYVNDKGKGGRCEGNHPFFKCDNPNKCSKADNQALQ